MSAWTTGDVSGIAAEINHDWTLNEASRGPEPIPLSRLSRGTHARVRGFSYVRALASAPERDEHGAVDEHATRELILAVLAAVDIIDDELRQERETQGKALRAAGGAE